MNLNDIINIIEPYYELLFHLIVAVLSFLVWRAVRSIWSQEMDISQIYHFRRGASEYWDPARSHSKSFAKYLELALTPTKNSQYALVEKLSELLNENTEITSTVSKKDLSPNLTLLLEDPEKWLNVTWRKGSSGRLKRKRKSSEILYEEIFKILAEVDSLYDVQIFPTLEKN